MPLSVDVSFPRGDMLSPDRDVLSLAGNRTILGNFVIPLLRDGPSPWRDVSLPRGDMSSLAFDILSLGYFAFPP